MKIFPIISHTQAASYLCLRIKLFPTENCSHSSQMQPEPSVLSPLNLLNRVHLNYFYIRIPQIGRWDAVWSHCAAQYSIAAMHIIHDGSFVSINKRLISLASQSRNNFGRYNFPF